MEVAEKEPEDGQRTSGRSTETSKEIADDLATPVNSHLRPLLILLHLKNRLLSYTPISPTENYLCN